MYAYADSLYSLAHAYKQWCYAQDVWALAHFRIWDALITEADHA